MSIFLVKASDEVLQKCDVELAANHPSMFYIRSSGPATATLYIAGEKFEIGKSKVRYNLFSEHRFRIFKKLGEKLYDPFL